MNDGSLHFDVMVSYSLFYLWVAFVFAAPVALLIARPGMKHRRGLGIVAYVTATALWLFLFYRFVPEGVAGWRLGPMAAAAILCVSPWVLSGLVSFAVRQHGATAVDGSRSSPG